MDSVSAANSHAVPISPSVPPTSISVSPSTLPCVSLVLTLVTSNSQLCSSYLEKLVITTGDQSAFTSDGIGSVGFQSVVGTVGLLGSVDVQTEVVTANLCDSADTQNVVVQSEVGPGVTSPSVTSVNSSRYDAPKHFAGWVQLWLFLFLILQVLILLIRFMTLPWVWNLTMASSLQLEDWTLLSLARNLQT